MKTAFLVIFVLTLSFTGCTTKDSVSQALNNNPDLIFDVIKKNPEKFTEVAQAANQQARAAMMAKQREEETKQREEQFKNPAKPLVSPDRALLGKKDAPVLIVMYSDFQCPYCSRGSNVVDEVRKEYGDKVALLYKHLPLDFHEMALPTAKYYEAIALQSPEMAYKFHDEIYKNQQKLGAEKEKFLQASAKKVGANMAKLKTSLNSKEVLDRIEADKTEAKSFGISGTPAFIVGGVKVVGAQPITAFQEIINRRLKGS
jgi:protein-disulfide isomerase